MDQKKPNDPTVTRLNVLINLALEQRTDEAHDDSDPSAVDSAVAAIRGQSYQPRYCFRFDASLIQEVVIDPRTSDAFLARVQSVCASAPGTTHTIVRKSNLYERPS